MITKNYIKMCEQAEEIQKEWLPKGDDKFFDCFDEGIRTLACYKPLSEREIIIGKWKEEAVWLPTQEQLQEMMQKYYQCNPDIKGLKWGDSINLFMLKRFLDFAVKNRKLVWDINSLWLAFVMKERWDKSWTGEKWVKVK